MNLTKQLEAAGPFDIDGDIEEAKASWVAFRVENGYKAEARPLLGSPESNRKLSKLSGMTLANYGLSLLPADASGIDVCTWRTPLCTKACVLSTAGNAGYPSVRKGRAVKTQFLAAHPDHFVVLLAEEIRQAAEQHPGGVAVRLNVASDIRWERVAPRLFELPVTFYDYTKAPASQRDDMGGRYHLTFSVSERPRSEVEAVEWLSRGGSAAVVFDVKPGHELPATWKGFQVIDADVQDGRYTDPKSTVAGLRAKGAGRGGKAAGFVKEGVST